MALILSASKPHHALQGHASATDPSFNVPPLVQVARRVSQSSKAISSLPKQALGIACLPGVVGAGCLLGGVGSDCLFRPAVFLGFGCDS